MVIWNYFLLKKEEEGNLNTYRIGETVTCKCTVQRAGANYNPLTSRLIYIYIQGTDAAIIDGVGMSSEVVGVWTYDFQTAGRAAGTYRWTAKCTDGTKIAIKDRAFNLEA